MKFNCLLTFFFIDFYFILYKRLKTLLKFKKWGGGSDGHKDETLYFSRSWFEIYCNVRTTFRFRG